MCSVSLAAPWYGAVGGTCCWVLPWGCRALVALVASWRVGKEGEICSGPGGAPGRALLFPARARLRCGFAVAVSVALGFCMP